MKREGAVAPNRVVPQEQFIGFCPSRITEAGAFFIPKNELNKRYL
jgi:hypothetical protein